MGNNESLPPPPPPGQPPVPPTPPAYQPPPPPPYTPPTEQFPPTTQIPVTPPFPPAAEFPPTQAFPDGPPGGDPPSGATAFEQPAEPPKKNTGLIIAGGLAAAAAIVAGLLIFSGGDDDKTVTPGSTTLSETTVFNTLPETTLPPEDTLVITLPVITEPPVTEPPVTEPEVTAAPTTIVSGVDPITDDLNKFTVVLPAGLQVDTTPIVTDDDFTLASVTGAADLEGFYSEDVTFGMSVIVVGPEVGSDPAEVLLFLEPEEGICTGRQEIADHPTALGLTTLVKLDGCSPDGSAAKVLIVMALPERSSVLAIYAQGAGTADGLLPQAQLVFESVRPV